ncbi:MAG: hypothetical protein IPL09_02860 [Bacteroidetes bacterium]|jgi:hypothetical protein|nr:hypothetical protein [Bacteroidota bacterium]HQW46292.1 hypothetical protein [Chitinophagaceae bacterium]MBK6818176.1 hypothetical protein [Bacteroidota bacterium]MBK7040605.1 hypothetical protein [Bacteroidota bacterium]MBK7589666.1 hypothetical protein [Bacteroidota bacterium]
MIKNKLESLNGSKFASIKTVSLTGSEIQDPVVNGLHIGGSKVTLASGPEPSEINNAWGQTRDTKATLLLDGKYKSTVKWDFH